MLIFSRIRNKRKKRVKESVKVTKMLILVVTAFLVIEIPLMIITILHALSTEDQQLLDYDIAEKCILIINTLTCLTSPLSLAIYCRTSKLFRDTFKSIFLDRFAGTRETDPVEV